MDSSISSSSLEDELAELAQSLKGGVEICDRKWRTKTYPDCFLHSDAVSWMMRTVTGGSEDAAVTKLNALRECGYIQHVVDPNKPFKARQTKMLYFCFVQDKQVARARWQVAKIQLANRQGTKTMTAGKQLKRRDVETIWQGSDEWVSHKTRVDRMEDSILKLTETQVAVQTKLEIVHQATISLIQTVAATALLLLILLAYTLLVIIPSLHQTTGIVVLTAITGTVLIGAFVRQGRDLFSVWLALDSCVVQASQGTDAVEDYEVALTRDFPLDNDDDQPFNPRKSRRAMMRKARSSIILKEPLLVRAQSSHLKLVQKVQQRQPNDLPDPSLWPHRPVFCCVNTPVDPSLFVPEYQLGALPLGQPFRFSSDLFEGQCLIRLKHVPHSDNPEGDAAYFNGRRRLFQTVVQGRFKEPLPLNNVLTGHEFVKPLQNLPHPWILKAATNLIGKLAPGAEIQVVGSEPTMLASMAATSQVVRGDEPGNEPDICSSADLKEDCSCFGGKFSTGKISTAGRKLHLASPTRAAQYNFDTETVYTFDFYQSLLNVATYSLDLGVANVGMAPVLNGQPIQCLCKTSDGRYLWSFQIWHESLLPDPEDDEQDKKSR
ncbi:expressed unknown protein [Seminavis robusta]|uniref:DEP domain-containing protein n=1 Tax=Seminavis robusta TaxID=568900 RepID=A0A9N8DPK3_9STRA|nr:expressed unknown protein [Seminavis robusta]|eukprot:Sro279_g106770.1 n/a (604) ;mRNA; f:30008-31819